MGTHVRIMKMTLKCKHIGETSYIFAPFTTGNIPQQKNFPFHEIHSSPLSLSLGVRKYVARGPGGGARVERKRGGRADHLESERASERRIAVVSGRVVAYCDCDRISPMPKQCRFTSERAEGIDCTNDLYSRSRQKGSEIECDANAVIESRQIYGVHYARRPQWCCYSTSR